MIAVMWLVDCNAGKPTLVLFDWSNNTGAIDVNIDGSFLEELSSFKMLCCLFLLYWTEVLTLSLLLKLTPRKLDH